MEDAKKKIYATVQALENGLTRDTVFELVVKNIGSVNRESLFPFYVEQNNSYAFGFIPDSIMSLTDFHEEDLYQFIRNFLENDPRVYATLDYKDDIQIVCI